MSWILSVYFLFLLSPGNAESKDKMASQELTVLIAKEGQSVNLTCEFTHRIEGLYLKRILGKAREVLYVTQHGKNKKDRPAYENRTDYFEVNNTATITLKQLKKNDSDIYMCVATLTIEKNLRSKNSTHILLAVEAAPEKKSSESPWMLYCFISVLMLLVFILGSYIFIHADIKKCFQRRHGRKIQNLVYEDMTYSLRRNSPETKINHYTT